MGKRYYCDYCERSFIDDVESRKKHIKSINHEVLRRAHYKKYRDLKTLVDEERGKTPCKRYRTPGQCPYGDNCNYSHFTEAELRNFELTVKQEELNKLPAIPNVEDWMRKRSSCEKLVAPIIFSEDKSVQMYKYHLPPSLMPASKKQILNCKFEEWGRIS